MPKIFFLKSIRGRLFLLLLIVLVSVLFVEAFIYYKKYETRKHEELQANLELARAVSGTFGAFVADVFQTQLVIGIVATSSPPPSKDSLRQILQKAQEAHPMLHSFSWISPEGINLVTSAPMTADQKTTNPEQFSRIAAGEDRVVSPVYLSSYTGGWVFSIFRAIRDTNGKVLGVVSCVCVTEKLDQLLAVQRSKDAGISLIDNKGFHVYRYPSTEYTGEQRNWFKHYPMIEDSLKGKDVLASVVSKSTGRKRLVAFTPIASIGWVASASRAEGEVIKEIRSTLFFQAGLVLFITLLGFATAAALAHPISKSIVELRNQALALGLGEMEEMAPVSGPEELRDLAVVFNQMAGDIRSREAALTESEERLRALVTASSDVVYRMSPDWSEMRYLHGRDFLADTGAPDITWLQKYIHPDDQPHVMAVIKEAIRTKSVFELEHRVLRADGTLGWTFSRAIPLLNTNGEIIEWFGAASDITERKRAEEALKESEERYRGVVENTTAVIFRIDPAGIITFANQRALEFFGYSAEELIGKHAVGTVVPPRESSGRDLAKMVEQIAVNPDAFHTNANENICKDGRRVWLEWTNSGIYGPDGKLKEFFCVGIDATARKEAEEALRVSERKYRRLHESMRDAFVVVDMAGRIQECNAAYREMLGYNEAELRRLNYLDLTPLRWHAMEAKIVAEQILTTGSSGVYEKEYRRKDGTVFPVELRTYLLADDAGQPHQMWAIVRDITERKHAEEALRKAYDELEKRVQERTSELSEAFEKLRLENIQRKKIEDILRESETQVRFFASQCLTAQETERKRIAGELHDSIAASLSAMKLRIETTANELKQGHGNTESLHEIASHAREITNEIRRIMADLRPSILDDLGIIAAVNWFCREYQKTYSHISVESQIGASEDEIPDSLKTPIFRICQEAMNNIAKYSKASLVNLSLRKEDAEIQLMIRDNGEGFDLDTVRKGMGLSTMRERAQLSGGTFDLESAMGKGTVIRASWTI